MSVILGIISDFLGKSCCSKKVITDFQSNIHLNKWDSNPAARETGAPWTDTSVNNRSNLLLKLDKLGFQPSKQGRQKLPRLILQSITYETYY